jgi:hypothetical protein
MADDTSQDGASATDPTALNDIATNGNLLNQNISALTTAVEGLSSIVLPVTRGGTGLDHVDTGDLLYGSATNVYSLLSDVATGNALLSGGVGSAPSWGKITPSHFSGTLPVANGGTSKTSFTAYALICGGTTTTGALQSVASVGTSGQLLTSNGAGALPTFQTFVDGIGGIIAFPDNQSYRIWLNSPFPGTITSTTTRSTAGTCTLTFNVNGSGIGGTANSVSTTQQTQSHSASFSAGDYIEMTVSSNSSCQNMSFMLAFTRP